MRNKSTVFMGILAFVFLLSAIAAPAQVRRLKVDKQKLPTLSFKPDLKVEFPLARHTFDARLARKIVLKVRNIGNAVAKNFFVDFILSTDTHAPMQFATFSATWHEDVLVKGGRMHIDHLAAGGMKTLTLQAPLFKPKGMPKIVYLGAVADSGKTVLESNEKNNMAFFKPHFPTPMPAHITSVNQSTIMGSGSGNIELYPHGTGFGATQGTRQLKLGQHVIPIEPGGWSDTWAVGMVLDNLNIPYGVTYGLRITDGGSAISNTVQVLLKLDLEGITYPSTGYIWQGHAGEVLELHAYKLNATQGNWTLHFGPQTISPTSWSQYKIVFTCPALPPGQYKVWIENNGVDICLSKYNFTILP